MEVVKEETERIKAGEFVVVQRQGYTKLHKLKPQGTLSLGSFTIEMTNVIGERYFDTFQMKNFPGNKRLFTLEKTEDTPAVSSSINIEKSGSGSDNRNISDDGQSQNLTTEDITKLKSEQFNTTSIVEQLVNNSKTFNSKTEYSQEKYIKKKEKKYFEYVQIKKPTIRLLASMFFRQDPAKIQGVRIDDLSQILTYSNIESSGVHLLYDSGSCGLVSAAITDRIGAKTSAQLVHMHPGNECQRNAFVAMQFPQEQSERCINVNLYSVLRWFYQKKREEPEAKRVKLEEKQKWQVENERACSLLENGCDSLVIIAKEHPVNIFNELVQFLKGGRSLVVFSASKEPLNELYNILKERLDIVCIKILGSFMRSYQVLPERTHPEVNMTSGGYILTAFKLV